MFSNFQIFNIFFKIIKVFLSKVRFGFKFISKNY
ncbi:MAG: hypothetical protein RL757_1807 [Bacteroidota bacterium]|jgi:hypothetical protein